MRALSERFDQAIRTVKAPTIQRFKEEGLVSVRLDTEPITRLLWEDATVQGARWWLALQGLRQLAAGGPPPHFSEDEEEHPSPLADHISPEAATLALEITRSRWAEHPEFHAWALVVFAGWDDYAADLWLDLAKLLTSTLAPQHGDFVDRALTAALEHIDSL